jgi:ferric-dicitrate binding protein FerR (iron transport regulator)
MKCLDRNSLDEQTRLVPRYVAGDLSRSERAEFEAWLVASPELAAEVDMERRLRRGMASAARRGWLNRGAPAQVAQNHRWHMAIAASVLVSIGLALSLTLPRNDTGGSEPTRLSASSGTRIASPLTVRLGKVRGAGDVPDIKLTLADAPSELIVEPDVVVLTCENGAVELECSGGGIPQTPQYAEYEVDLVKRRGSTLAWRSARQEPAMRTELSFMLRDPGSLSAGDYDLIVRGVSPEHQEVVGRFWVQVTR